MARLTRAQQNLFIQTCLKTQTPKDNVFSALQSIVRAQPENMCIAIDLDGLASYSMSIDNTHSLFIRLPREEMKRFKYFVKYYNQVLKNQ